MKLTIIYICIFLRCPEKLLKFIDRFVKPPNRWSKIIFPIINECFPQISIKEITSVQPMSEPTAKVFYLDFKHG